MRPRQIALFVVRVLIRSHLSDGVSLPYEPKCRTFGRWGWSVITPLKGGKITFPTLLSEHFFKTYLGGVPYAFLSIDLFTK